MSGGEDEFSLYNLAENHAALGDLAEAIETGAKAAAVFPPLQPNQPMPSQQATVGKSFKGCHDLAAKRLPHRLASDIAPRC